MGDITFKPTSNIKEVDENLQNQFNTILKILNKTEEDIIGGLVHIDDLTVEQLHAIIEAAPDFYNGDRNHNWSPSNNQFDKFITENPQFILEAYVVNPKREDYRFNIVGVKAPSNKENKVLLFDFINSLGTDNQPDEYGEYNGFIRAWWD